MTGPFVAMATAAVVWFLRVWLFGRPPAAGDIQSYLDIARGVEPLPPWSLHLLTPWIAGTLFPATPLRGFWLVALTSFIASAAALERLLAHLRSPAKERALGVALFFATCTGVFMFRHYSLVDALSYCLLAWSCLWTLQRRDLRVASATAIGVLNRETALFVIPVWLWSNRGAGRRGLSRSVAVFLPAALVYLLIHKTSWAYGHSPRQLDLLSPQVISSLWSANLSWLGSDIRSLGLGLCVMLAYGPAWLTAGLGLIRALRHPRGSVEEESIALWMVVLPSAFALTVGVDWRRGFQPLFCAVIVSAVLGLRGLSGRRWAILAAATVAGSAAMTEAWWAPRMRGPIILALCLWAVAALAVFGREERPLA
jgi:hypothetical protein